MMRLLKFNQEHDQKGRFSGPGTSHQPTGNPVGRPRQADYGKEPIDRSLTVAGGGIAGNVGGEMLGGAAGAALGSVVPIVGSAAGAFAGQWLGGLAGDYVGAKIGATLYDLKQQMDGHPVGVGHFGEMTPGDQAAMIGSNLGGTASWLAFGGRAGAAGAALAGRLGARPGSFGARLGFHAGKAVADEAGGAIGALAGRGFEHASSGKDGGGRAGAVKKAYDGSFSSMVPNAMPRLFGPKQWAEIEGTPFAGYIRSRVKDTADKLDDRGVQLGLSTKPSPKTANLFAAHYAAAGHVAGAQPAVVDPRMQQVQQQQQQQAAQGQQPVGKAFAFPDDVASAGTSVQQGGIANIRYLRMLQEADRNAQLAQMKRAFRHGPLIQNLSSQLPAKQQDLGTPQLFTNERPAIYRVRKRSKGGDPRLEVGGDASFRITADFAKGLTGKLDQGLVYGWASIIEKGGEVVTDHQNDRITPDELVKAAHDFVSNSRQGGVLHDEYGHKIGHIVESVVFTKEMQGHLGVDLGKVGWLIGYQITDPKVKTLMKSGMLKAFSIGGRGRREAGNA